MNKFIGAVSHREREIEELAADPDLAAEYLKMAIACLADPVERTGGLLGLRSLVDAYGELGGIAAAAGISPDALDRALVQLDPELSRLAS
ncbi:transcriptional regulator [Massilia sp. R2A-15]|uniref:transcriptional regulator n=1 Tax=Massilia sp. R2A-15 TaxID=3064278 RepID=UPI002734258B|nr:transcriptional regulator [Massilia sp. R2A-15]WLI87874.1 transcriptional regulator [Massilia sp. R2A-15]